MATILKERIKRYRPSLVMSTGGKAPSGGAAVSLFFDMQRQVQSQWCWAATSASVSIFYNNGSTWTQCRVAQQILGSDCCGSPGPCNKPWYLNDALTVTNNFVAISNPLTFQQVVAELSAGRVVGARVGWYGGGGHFMVIYGYNTINGVNYYNIDDPIYGKSQITESGFLNAYQGAGGWTHSYTTKS